MKLIIESTFTTPIPDIKILLQELNLLLLLKIEFLALHLVSDEEIIKINREYLHHNYYTDIITFDLRDEDSSEAEIFISLDRVRENASLLGVSSIEELNRVCIHGMLHLAGFKDETVSQKKEMRELENKYLDKLFHVKR